MDFWSVASWIIAWTVGSLFGWIVCAMFMGGAEQDEDEHGSGV